jgi:8-oxo-dGTP pyrophosphatase MutT (NUDIX family)
MSECSVIPIDHIDFAFVPRRWTFAEERRSDIEAYFAARRRKTPELWNGRVLALSDWSLDRARLRGTFFETDFASFLAWRDWGTPDPSVTNCFAMGALRTGDGAFLLGVMAPHTASAGRIYFPSGTPDPSDIVGSKVDLTASVLREMTEETGLTSAEYTAQPGWIGVTAGRTLSLMKPLDAPMSAAELRRVILDRLAREAQPELADIRIVRGPDDLDPMMPPFMTAFLAHAWSASGSKNGAKSDPTPAK